MTQRVEDARFRLRNPNIPALDARPSRLTWSDRCRTPTAYESHELGDWAQRLAPRRWSMRYRRRHYLRQRHQRTQTSEHSPKTHDNELIKPGGAAFTSAAGGDSDSPSQLWRIHRAQPGSSNIVTAHDQPQNSIHRTRVRLDRPTDSRRPASTAHRLPLIDEGDPQVFPASGRV